MQQKFENGRVIAALGVAALAGALSTYDIINVNRVAGTLEDEGLYRRTGASGST